MAIDHIGITVSDYRRSRDFYSKSLAPLGIVRIVEIDGWAGFGSGGIASFWFGEDDTADDIGPVHIAFTARDEEHVRAFYFAAMDAGGGDNGKPGLRELYHPGYYGAFVLDPDGHNVEAVFHGSNGSSQVVPMVNGGVET